MASRSPQLELPIIRDAEPDAGDVVRRPPSRPKTWALRDPTAMSVVELLAVVLGPSREPICADLAATYGNLRGLAGAHPADLRDRGLNAGSIEKLSVVFEIARRFGEQEFVPGQPFRGSYDVYAHFRERLAAERQERFIAVLLD